MSTATITTTSPTLSCRAAAARLGVGNTVVCKWAALGRIRITAEVGSPVRYNSDDVEKLLAERTAAQATT